MCMNMNLSLLQILVPPQHPPAVLHHQPVLLLPHTHNFPSSSLNPTENILNRIFILQPQTLLYVCNHVL
jgi:hypothetical protein